MTHTTQLTTRCGTGLEPLEPRRLLSVAVSRGGTLFSTGTSGNDLITLVRDSRRASRLYVI